MSNVSRVSLTGSSHTRQEIEAEFKASMKRMSPYVFNAPLLPELKEPTGPMVALFRGKVPTVIPVERADFYNRLTAQAKRMEIGSAYYLCAGTGVGKSTRVPLALVKIKQALGIVVVPTRGIRDHVAAYVKSLTSSGTYSGVTVSVATKIRDVTTATSQTVLFMTATDLLGVLAVDRDLFTKHHVGFLYVDEFHECIPQYYLLNWLIHTDWFKNTVVLLGSATGAVRMEERVNGDMPHEVRRVPNELMEYEDLPGLSQASPLHYGSMNGARTLVFLPRESDFPAAKSYYMGHNVLTFELTFGMSRSRLNRELQEIAKCGTCVVLTTQSYETAYTIPVNRVVNTGFTVDLRIDSGEMLIDYAVADESEAQTTQRCGRVGRLEGGIAYTRDCALFAGPTLTPGSEIYVALWMRVLGVRMRDERIDTWVACLNNYTYDKILSLLRSSVHAVIIRDYFGSKHVCLRYTDMLLSSVLKFDGEFKIMDEHYSVYTSLWREQVLNLRIGNYDYKAVWFFGDTFRGIPAYLFFVMKHGKFIAKSEVNVAASVASSAMDLFGVKSSRRDTGVSRDDAPRTPTSVRRLYEGSPTSSRKYGGREMGSPSSFRKRGGQDLDEVPFGSSALSTVSSSVAREVASVYAALDDKRGTKEFAFDLDADSTKPPTFHTVEPDWKQALIRDHQLGEDLFSPTAGGIERGSPRERVTAMVRDDGEDFELRLRRALHDHLTSGDRSIPFGPSSRFASMVFVPVDMTEYTYKTQVALLPLNAEAACMYFLRIKQLGNTSVVNAYSGSEGGRAWVETCVVWNANVGKYIDYKNSNIADRALNRSPKHALIKCLNNFRAFGRHGVRFALMPSFDTGLRRV